MEIVVNGVNDALPAALGVLKVTGIRHTAASVANERPTFEHPGVFITVYQKPNQNVLFDPVRDANPFFHYLEAMWILAGRNDVAFLKHVLPGMARYTDDSTTYHGAYGYRLRNWGELDQIEHAIALLKAKPTTRQVVMSIWNPMLDLGTTTKDMPCNDMIMLKVRDGKLNLTVCNRSNDAVLGAYGANAVQFSMLLMYMAARIGVDVGRYTQVSDSMHVYEDDPYWKQFEARGVPITPYASIADYNLFEVGIDKFDKELADFFNAFDAGMSGSGCNSPAIRDAHRMLQAVEANREKHYDRANELVAGIEAPDWKIACQQWLQRRKDRRDAK